MITTSTEYLEKLWKIQDANPITETTFTRVPEDEPIYKVNWNSRTVKAPKFLSVSKDHTAETVFFECDRYFDNVDLATKVGVVQYVNANNQAGIYPIRYYDLTTENKIIFGWCISGCATRAPGAIKFSIKFYEVEMPEKTTMEDGTEVIQLSKEDKRKLAYSIETQPVTSQILYGMDIEEEVEEEYEITATLLDEINQALSDHIRNVDIYWIEC